MLIGSCFITALLCCFSRQQIIDHWLFCMVGIAREQFFNLLMVAFRQFHQCGLGLSARTAAFPAGKPATGAGSGTENTAQQPLNTEDHQQ